MLPLVTAAQMRRLDRIAINQHRIPALELMENAGRETVLTMIETLGDPAGRPVAIFVGPGNNGGDGLVIARLLFEHLARPTVYLLVPPEKLAGDPAINLKRLEELPVPIILVDTDDRLAAAQPWPLDSWALVDALFGTGLSREISGRFATMIKLINASAVPTVAVDIASGLDADRGVPLGICIRADLTVTFGEAKIGQVIHPGPEFTGELVVADIGIPAAANHEVGITTELVDERVGFWLPERQAAAHKGNFGHLLITAGSTGKTGAAMLSAVGALRSGVGLVSLAVPYELNSVFETSLWEAMTIPLNSSTAGSLSIENYPVIVETAASMDGMVLGPGLGTASQTAELILKLYRELPLPMVVDADALNILAAEPSVIRQFGGPRVLTPHPGEMARMMGGAIRDIQTDRITAAREFVEKNRVHLVLKGANSLIGSPDGRIAVNPSGNPGMATGGMGDVLAGVIGSLLAQGLPPWRASCLGTYAHGLAGDLLAEETPFGFLASELAAALPGVFQRLRAAAEIALCGVV